MRKICNNSLVLRWAAALACLLPTLVANGYTGKLYTSDRLSSSMLTTVCQDSCGYLWIGSEYGLNKFDGYNFTTYLSSKNDTTTIPNNNVSCLFVDRSGRLWIGFSKGLAQYDYKNDRFIRYNFPEGLKPRVSSMVENERGLLIGTAGYGLFAIRRGAAEISCETLQCEGGDFCSRLFIDDRGYLWRAGHLPQVSRLRTGDYQTAEEARDYELTCGPAVEFLKADVHGFYIVCLYGIMRYDYATGRLEKADIDMATLLGNVSLRAAHIDSEGNMFIGSSGNGLMVVRKGSARLEQMESPDEDDILATANVNDVFEDRNHNLWISCYNKGLYQLRQGETPFSSWSLSQMDVKTGSGISSMAVDDKGNIWCTVQNNGVYVFDEKGMMTPHPEMPATANIVYYDKQGGCWLCSENTLYSYDNATKQSSKRLQLEGWGLNRIADDGEGRLFLSDFGKGLCIYDTKSGKCTGISTEATADSSKATICNNWIEALFCDSEGLLWIGTTEGVSCLNPKNLDKRPYEWNELLKGYNATVITEAPDGNIVIGTHGGLFVYEKRKHRLEEFADHSGSTGIGEKDVRGLVYDSDGDLWISTSEGLWLYDREQDRFMTYLHGGGLKTKEYRQGASFRLNNDLIGFGTNNGITTFFPKRVKDAYTAPGKVYLTRLAVGGKSADCQRETLSIPAGENVFSLELSTLDFTDTGNITFEYRMNKAKEWTAISEGTNTLYFNNMAPGTYNFEVRAIRNGITSEKTSLITLCVAAPWYLSDAAKAVGVIILAAAIALGFLYCRSRKREEASAGQFPASATLTAGTPQIRKTNNIIQMRPVEVVGNNDALMKRIMKAVNENITDPDFNVETLAKTVGISRTQLHRKMKEITGITTSEFIRNLRLEQAARLLREGKINITQVAYAVGYSNQPHFSTVFKRHFGLSPTEYAEKEHMKSTTTEKEETITVAIKNK